MELFHSGMTVRLKSHHEKYLVACDDEKHVTQSSDGSVDAACWTVELVENQPHVLCLRSLYNRYLTASNELFLLGFTGKKVLQTLPTGHLDSSVVWEPIKEGIQFKLKTRDGRYLRANGGPQPWRNSVTHDGHHTTGFREWIFWEIQPVVTSAQQELQMPAPPSRPPPHQNRSHSPHGSSSSPSPKVSELKQFHVAKVVRLRGHHGKYLIAGDDAKHVTQGHDGAAASAYWTVELVSGAPLVLRLRSCYNHFLTASNEHFLLGFTGKQVFQTHPDQMNSSVEWKPIQEDFQSKFKLKNIYNQYLRANGGLPPWRNSVTHDIPTTHHGSILWEVEIVETLAQQLPQSSAAMAAKYVSFDQFGPLPTVERRNIFYVVADDEGNVDDTIKWPHLIFTGTSLDGLPEVLRTETGLDEILLCTRNLPSKQLIPFWLQLPPNNADIQVIVVDANSTAGRSLVTWDPYGRSAAQSQF